MTTPRVMTKDQMIAGLKAGRTLCVDRKDAPELADLFELERQGLVVSTFIELDIQSSLLKFRWKGEREKVNTDDQEERCPSCGVSLDGGPIPEDLRKHYSPPYRWSRVISVYDRSKDRHDHWRCPDCKYEWEK